MSDDYSANEKVKKSFWDTTMGTITKITALLTAITGFILAINPYLKSCTPANTTSTPSKTDSQKVSPPTTTTQQTATQKEIFFQNVESILYKVKFNSSIDDVLNYELGETHPNIYDSLPIAAECEGNTPRYYWRYMKESPVGKGVLNFFENKGLKNYINDNSFVVYSFKDNRLTKIDLRIFSSVNNFYEEFINALGLNSNDFPSKYIAKNNSVYYIAGNNRSENSFHLIVCNYEGYTLCGSDWWNR